MTFESKVNFYNFNPDMVAQYLMVNDWKGCWEYMRSLIESFSIKLDQSHNLSIQKQFSDKEKRQYAEQFGGLMGELIFTLLTHPEARIDDENYKYLIYIHEVIHAFFELANLADTDAIVSEIITSKKRLEPSEQKKVLLLMSLKTDLDILSILKKTKPQYRGLAVSGYLGYLRIYEDKIYANKQKIYDVADSIEWIKDVDNKSLISILSPYFSCSYLNFDGKHLVKKHINKILSKFFAGQTKEIERMRAVAAEFPSLQLDRTKPTILILWEYFYDGHAMLRVWGPWVKALENQFNVVNISHKQFEGKCDKAGFQNKLHFASIGDIYQIADYLKTDIMIFPSIGMSFWGVAASNLRFAPTQIQCLGHPATTYSDKIDFIYGNAPMLDERAFPEDKILSDKLPLTYEARLNRDVIENLKPTHYEKGSGRPLKVSIIGSEIKVCAPFMQLLKDIEVENDFDIEFSFHLGTSGMDTLYAEKVFLSAFKNVKYYGWQTYEEYLSSMLEADIVLNPFPFGHTNTLIDSLCLGKPCIGLEGVEPASLTEKMILEEVGMRDMFSAQSIEDYKDKFRTLSKRIMNGDTEFYDRMKMFDILHSPAKMPDYAESLRWVYENADALKAADRKRFEIGGEI